MEVLGNEVLSPPTEDKYNHRPLADFPPSGWGDYFVAFPLPLNLEESSNQRIKELKNEVKALFRDINKESSTQNHAKALTLISDLQRLGIAYHFEEEINESVGLIQGDDDEECDDIEIVALRFSLLRRHGHDISSDVFQKFKDKEGKFKIELISDMKGLLHLYDASFLGTYEDEILDEAFNFCKDHMEQYVMAQTDNGGGVGGGDDHEMLVTKIKRELETPFFRRIRRLEARHSIEFYGKDKACNHVLLELASLDFNLVQSLHQAEIKLISKWWKELRISKDLCFARERLVECYFWSLGVHWEPQYSKGRILLAKLFFILVFIDDLFDAYGTMEELRLFTHMVQRWDFEAVDQLSGSARAVASFFKHVNDEIRDEIIKNGMLNQYHYVKECFKMYVEGYFVEATWAREGFTPTLQQYLSTSIHSSGYPFLICITPVINGEEIPLDVMEWVLKLPTVVEASSKIARLMDDLVSTKFEQQRMHVASGVQCYMNEYGVTEQEACAEIGKMIASAWKDMNKGLIDPCPFRRHLNLVCLDYSRVTELLFKYEDLFTNPSGEMRKYIAAVLVHPV